MKTISRLLLSAALGVGLVPALATAGLFDAPAIPTAPLARPEQAQQGTDPRLGAMLSRIGELEEEVRRLRGRIEELEHAQRQSDSRIDRLVGDVDRRLSGMEGRGSADDSSTLQPTGRGTPPPGTAALPPVAGGRQQQSLGGAGSPGRAPGALSGTGATSSATTSETDRSSPEQDAAAKRGYVLGTIPRDTVMGIDQPTRQPDVPQSPRAGSGSRSTALSDRDMDRSGGTRDQYETAIGLLQSGNWPAAQDAFESFLRDHPNDPQAANAAYWLGETFYVRQDRANAAAAFAKNYRAYGQDGPKAADNLLKLGMSLGKLGDRQRACQTFGELDRRHPNASTAIRQALARERAAYSCT